MKTQPKAYCGHRQVKIGSSEQLKASENIKQVVKIVDPDKKVRHLTKLFLEYAAGRKESLQSGEMKRWVDSVDFVGIEGCVVWGGGSIWVLLTLEMDPFNHNMEAS